MAEFRSHHHRSYNGGVDRNLDIVNQAHMNNPSRWPEPTPTTIPTSRPPPPTSSHRVPNKNKKVDSKTTSSSSSGASAAAMKSSWSFNDPEMKRRKRVVKYKSYAVEGKVKASFGKGFRWIRNKCAEIVYGY